MIFLQKKQLYKKPFHRIRNNKKTGTPVRIGILQMVFAALLVLLLYRLWDLQIVNGEKYAQDYELKITRTIRDKSTRGAIYDCNGEILAYNELTYKITMTDEGVYASNRERQLMLNSIIYRVVKRLEENHETINNDLKIVIDADSQYAYTVSGTALTRLKADIFGKANPEDMTSIQREMSADALVEYLSSNTKFALYGEGKRAYTEEELQHYHLPGTYTAEEVLSILGIRYMLSLNDYKKYVPVIVAGDVTEQTAAYILENSASLTGVGVSEDWKRVYTGGEAFSHILGYIGKISSDELEQYADSDQKYTADSVVGKAGIEQYLEAQLQGTDGERQITVNNRGKIIGEDTVLQETMSGRDVYLSIDKNLQTVVYRILEQELAGILSSKLINAKRFDMSRISDSSQIRIPVYDVYLALIENHVIRLEAFKRSDATGLEQSMAATLDTKREEVQEALSDALFQGTVRFDQFPEEMQAYLSYIVRETGILREDAVGQIWENRKDTSVKELFMRAIEKGWIETGIIDSKPGYYTTDEMYALLVEAVLEKLSKDKEFDKILFQWLVLEDKITGKEICRLLYDQEILADTDEDYEDIMSGRLDAYGFIKKKIERLEITPAQLALDPCSASAVVVSPQTGKVLALVSYPGYDNNRLTNQMDLAYYNQLLRDQSLPLYNRATQQLTAPGSTLKPVTIIAGLQEEVISSSSTVFCDGVFDKVEPSLRCWKHTGHGTVTNASAALQFSCNDYMCEIAYRIGEKQGTEYVDNTALACLQKYAALFCLDQKSGIELTESEPHVTDKYGIPSAIGQGTHNYTTVQLARYVSAIASGGDVFSLSLIKGISGADSVMTKNDTVRMGRVALPESVWDTVHTGMQQFAQNNAVLKNMEISVAGKTGTAQEAKNRPDHALFVGYAPSDQPQIAVAVRIANGYGSSNATAVGKNIFEYYFDL
ncbi:MAG: peptidase [Lachnospiraceae bacterium]|nr:peptidase [Lachnospiraceae bacterium]